MKVTLVVLLLVAALATLASAEKRLIQTDEEVAPVWLTEEEVAVLIKAGKRN